ncbi:MAG TPA: ribokinase [Pseudothermotoga sp.]|nr:ribokinase [Pseudothermotoga sp.]HOK82996.1 ribokinase [Pseudothermotoga sp.]HPP69835.1 ribokinase [Pseudothermotoga sp.]
MNRVAIFGSFVVDLTAFSPHIPQVGETVFANVFKYGPGGKGFNQTVAAKKAGADVTFMTKIGRDMFASVAEEAFTHFELDKSYLLRSSSQGTGVALIIVDDNGRNAIAVVPGACNDISIEEVRMGMKAFQECDVFIAQFEANLDATFEAMKIAKKSGATTILNPAPVRDFDRELLRYVDILIPNEIEAAQLAGIPLDGTNALSEIASKLEMQVDTVIITLGEKGVFCSKVSKEIVPAVRVTTVDSTGAGDAFVGVFASYYSRGVPLKDAIDYARVGAAISTTRIGTSPSMPAKDEIEQLYLQTICANGVML